MEIPTEISFHELPYSDAVEAAIQRWVARIEALQARVQACRVFVMQPHRHQRTGRDFEIHVRLALPGTELAVSHNHHEDIYVAIADAFRAVRRQLIEETKMRSGHGRQQLSA